MLQTSWILVTYISEHLIYHYKNFNEIIHINYVELRDWTIDLVVMTCNEKSPIPLLPNQSSLIQGFKDEHIEVETK